MSNSSLFEEFKGISKAEWLAKISADLKGGLVEELDWEFEGLDLSPFYHREDLPRTTLQISGDKYDNSWRIGERFIASEICKTNEPILSALAYGVSAINVDFRDVDKNALPSMFSKIQHEWIDTHLDLNEVDVPFSYINEFCKTVESKGQNTSKVAGSIRISQQVNSYWEVIDRMCNSLPMFRIHLYSDVQESHDSKTTLRNILNATYLFLQKGQEAGIPLEVLFEKLQYELVIGDAYYKTVVLLRSVRLLVRHLCSTYETSIEPSICIVTWLDRNDQVKDLNYNIIKNTSQLHAATVGGADIIYPMCYLSERNDEYHNQRISRNINHVLQLESYMDRVVDPVAGSYFFDKLTDQLCKLTWEEFQNSIEG